MKNRTTTFCRGGHGELTARFHRETKKKKQFEVFVRQTDRQTDSVVDNDSQLGVEIDDTGQEDILDKVRDRQE